MKRGPGRSSPARILCAALLALMPAAPAAAWQVPPGAAVPDQSAQLKLLWSTMAAVDQANKTGNYSVLRDLGSSGFQTNNNAASLGAVFAAIRNQRVDLSDTLMLTPTWEIAPTIIGGGLLRMRGTFNMRPTGIGFDLIYEWNQGWRLHGVSIVPFSATAPQPAGRR